MKNLLNLLKPFKNISTGAHIGTVIAMPLSGVLAERLGWPSVFYVFGKL